MNTLPPEDCPAREALTKIAQHMSSDWPEQCIENVRIARAALRAPAIARADLLTLADQVRSLSGLFSDGRFAPSIAVEAVEILHRAAEALAGAVMKNPRANDWK